MRTPEEIIAHELKMIEHTDGTVISHYEGYTLLLFKLDAVKDEIKSSMTSRSNLETHLCRLAAMCIHVVNNVVRNPVDDLATEIMER